MDEVIKPCPFCGGEADYHSEKGPTGEVYGWVGCNQCDAMSCHTDTRSMQPEETHPIDAWNTRADAAPTPNAEVVEAVGFAMWKAEADRAAPNVGKNRAIENYRYDLDPIGRAKWDQIAQAAIAALDAARGQAEPAAWMPIKTAPKDGTTIDVWRDGHRYTVYWGLPPHCCGEMGQYCDSDWHGLKEPGWICSTFGEFVGGEHHPFTHWMPLPDAPEQSND